MGRVLTITLFTSLALALGGCVLAPKSAKDEQARLDAAGEPFRQPLEKRQLAA